MTNSQKFLEYIKANGRPLSESYPESPEIALDIHCVFDALNLLKETNVSVIGGDILSEDEKGKLGYIVHQWGYGYHFLNWSTEDIEGEGDTDHFNRSHLEAERAIKRAVEFSEKLDNILYIVLVV